MSKPRDDLLTWLAHLGFDLEVPFPGVHGNRRWRWDACKGKVCCEYSGIGPGHRWTAGVTRDYQKISEGQLMGLTVIVCNHSLVNDGTCLEYIERAMARGRDG